jgi:hypothetical protein
MQGEVPVKFFGQSLQHLQIVPDGNSQQMEEVDSAVLIKPHLTRKNAIVCTMLLCGFVLMTIGSFCIPDERFHKLSSEEADMIMCSGLGIVGPRSFTRRHSVAAGSFLFFMLCCCPCFAIDSLRQDTRFVNSVRDARRRRIMRARESRAGPAAPPPREAV